MTTNDDISRNLNVLLSRLTWPSAFVRERTCIVIAGLLSDLQYKKFVYEQLLKWLSLQTLESICVLGLLPLCKAKDNTQQQFVGSEVWAVLSRPSILAWTLVRELDENFEVSFEKSLIYTKDTTLAFTTNEFFKKYVDTYIPPIYSFWAEKIEEGEIIPFRAMWEYEWQELIKTQDVALSDRAIHYWMGGRPDDHILADTKMSEVYRSAFLRALAQATYTGRLDRDSAIYLASHSCPVDLDLWEVQPTRRPRWWPQLQETEQNIDTTIASIWQQVASLWEQKDLTPNENLVIARASGAIIQGTTFYELVIMGIFQKAHGPKAPDLAQVGIWHEESNDTQAEPNHKSLLKANGILYPSSSGCVKVFDDWSFVPATNYFRPKAAAPRWQPWRLRSRLWVPSSCLLDQPGYFECNTEAIIIYQGTDEIARWHDWTDGLSERHNIDLPFSSGEYLLFDRKFTEAFAEDTGSSFCWLCRLTRFYKEDEISDSYEKYIDYRIYGATPIINIGD